MTAGHRHRPAVRASLAGLAVTLVLAGCSDDSDDAVRDAVDQDASSLVLTGEVDGEAVDGVPSDRTERMELLLTGVDWEGAETTRLASGLLDAAEQDDTLVADVVEGAGGSDEEIDPELRSAVARLLEDDFDSVLAAYGAPLDAEPTLDPEPLGVVLEQVGDASSAYSNAEQGSIDAIGEHVPADLDGTTEEEWDAAMAQVEDDWTTPVGTVLGTMLRSVCADDEAECDDRIEQTQDFVGRQLRGAAYGAIPTSMLPDSLLLTTGERVDPLTENSPAYDDWRRIADQYPALDLVPAMKAAATGD